MKKNKQLCKKAVAILMVMLMAVTTVDTTVFAEETPVTKTTEDYYFYLMVDPGETAQGFVLEPTCIKIPAGTDTSKKLGEIICNNLLARLILVSCQGSYGYISGIRCAEAYDYQISDSTYSMYSSLPEVAFHEKIVKKMNKLTKVLGEYNFTGYSGWMFTLNNEMSTQYNGSSYWYTMGTTVQELMDMNLLNEDETPVVEMFFTMNMGADVGLGDAYLPTAVTYYESADKYVYDWSGDINYVAGYEKADRTELVMALADNKDDEDYAGSLAVLKDIDASEEDVEDAVYQVSN